MDNKKTFADLFKNVDTNTEEKDNKIDNLIKTEKETKDKEVTSDDNIHFSNGINDIFKMASTEIKEDITEKYQEENIKEPTKNIFGLEENITTSEINTVEENNTITKEEQKEVTEESTKNIFGLSSNTTTSEVNSVEENNTITKEEEKEVTEEPMKNIFGLSENTTTSEVNPVEENNTITKEEQKEVTEEPTKNIFGLSENNNENQKNIIEDKNDDQLKDEVKIVELTDNTSLDEKTYNDIFKKEENSEEQLPNIVEIEENNQISEKKSEEDQQKENNNSNEDFVVDNPLFNDMVSLDESNNIKKNIDKLNLANTKHFEVKVVQKKEPLIKFIIGVISYAFFIWLLLIGITLLVYVLDIKVRASKGDYSAPVFNAYVVLTGSMLPEIQVNDVVITKRVEAKELKVGDIITFASTDSRFAGTIITHRIIKKNPAMDGGEVTFQTKGDNNNVADSALVPASNIYGKVILKIPKLGWLQEFLATDGGWIIVILIPCLTVISYDIVKIFKGLKRKKYNNIKVKK